MKKNDNYTGLGLAELKSKYDSLVKEFVEFKLSMDVSVIKSSNNAQGLMKSLKDVRRALALAHAKKV